MNNQNDINNNHSKLNQLIIKKIIKIISDTINIFNKSFKNNNSFNNNFKEDEIKSLMINICLVNKFWFNQVSENLNVCVDFNNLNSTIFLNSVTWYNYKKSFVSTTINSEEEFKIIKYNNIKVLKLNFDSGGGGGGSIASPILPIINRAGYNYSHSGGCFRKSMQMKIPISSLQINELIIRMKSLKKIIIENINGSSSTYSIGFINSLVLPVTVLESQIEISLYEFIFSNSINEKEIFDICNKINKIYKLVIQDITAQDLNQFSNFFSKFNKSLNQIILNNNNNISFSKIINNNYNLLNNLNHLNFNNFQFTFKEFYLILININKNLNSLNINFCYYKLNYLFNHSHNNNCYNKNQNNKLNCKCNSVFINNNKINKLKINNQLSLFDSSEDEEEEDVYENHLLESLEYWGLIKQFIQSNSSTIKYLKIKHYCIKDDMDTQDQEEDEIFTHGLYKYNYNINNNNYILNNISIGELIVLLNSNYFHSLDELNLVLSCSNSNGILHLIKSLSSNSNLVKLSIETFNSLSKDIKIQINQLLNNKYINYNGLKNNKITSLKIFNLNNNETLFQFNK